MRGVVQVLQDAQVLVASLRRGAGVERICRLLSGGFLPVVRGLQIVSCLDKLAFAVLLLRLFVHLSDNVWLRNEFVLKRLGLLPSIGLVFQQERHG